MNARHLVLALAIFAIAETAHAQVFGANPLTILLSPQYPGPYQQVTVTPQSNIVNLAGANVTISVDGKVISQGSGATSASFTTGGPGTSNVVTISITSPDGNYSTSVTVRAASVSLVEEPISTTHPFYEGAPQVAIRGRVRFIALSDLRTSSGGTPISPSNLVYTWKVGDQIIQDSSGLGKSVLTVAAPEQYRSAVVSVTVSSLDGSLSGSANATIAPADPSLLFYEDGPLLGPLFDQAIGTSVALPGDEASYRAVPYSFASAPTFAWSVNGTQSVSDPVITLRPTGTGAGSAVVSATASMPDTYVSVSQQMTVEFGASAPSTIFGL